jgi:hypothetical protein
MIIQGTNLETGVEFQTVIEDLNQDFLASINNFSLTDDEIRKSIDNLNVSADVNSLLFHSHNTFFNLKSQAIYK